VIFEERELKDYSEPVTPGELREGEVYFAVQFLDDKMMVIPVVETLVYVGHNLSPDDVTTFYFQDAESHRQGLSYTSGEDQVLVYRQSAAHLNHIFEFERALEVLMACSLRRRRHEKQGAEHPSSHS